MKKHSFYFYTYDENDSVRVQQKRILGYSSKESIIVESLAFPTSPCSTHNYYWTNEYCRIRNFLNEYERQVAITEDNKKNGKICCICDESNGQLYSTTSDEFIHSECND